jgi:fructose-1,6-bisphosphatase/sedoheptulose 1,7-bisphosphatase-like protein
VSAIETTPVESPVHVTVTVNVEPIDVLSGLGGDPERVLSFVCQLLRLLGDADTCLALRDMLAEEPELFEPIGDAALHPMEGAL